MRKFRTYRVGVEQGSTILFSDYRYGGKMWVDTGPREFRVSASFEGSFSAQPIVHIAISIWDFASGTNQSANIATEEITSDGFDSVFRTWGDTKGARVRADWIAIGDTRDEDDWHL